MNKQSALSVLITVVVFERWQARFFRARTPKSQPAADEPRPVGTPARDEK
jgi:hypothetical protein